LPQERTSPIMLARTGEQERDRRNERALPFESKLDAAAAPDHEHRDNGIFATAG